MSRHQALHKGNSPAGPTGFSHKAPIIFLAKNVQMTHLAVLGRIPSYVARLVFLTSLISQT